MMMTTHEAVAVTATSSDERPQWLACMEITCSRTHGRTCVRGVFALPLLLRPYPTLTQNLLGCSLLRLPACTSMPGCKGLSIG